MPVGDKPECSGSKTSDQTAESTTDIQSEKKEKSDLMFDPESSKCDPISSHGCESGSGLQTSDLKPYCGSSLSSKRKKSQITGVSSEDEEIPRTLTYSEISEADSSNESDSGRQSPELKTDSSRISSFGYMGPARTKAKKDVIPGGKSCLAVISEVESQFDPLEDFSEDENLELEELDQERSTISESPPPYMQNLDDLESINDIEICTLTDGNWKCIKIMFAVIIVIVIIVIVVILANSMGGSVRDRLFRLFNF